MALWRFSKRSEVPKQVSLLFLHIPIPPQSPINPHCISLTTTPPIYIPSHLPIPHFYTSYQELFKMHSPRFEPLIPASEAQPPIHLTTEAINASLSIFVHIKCCVCTFILKKAWRTSKKEVSILLLPIAFLKKHLKARLKDWRAAKRLTNPRLMYLLFHAEQKPITTRMKPVGLALSNLNRSYH